MPKGPPTFLNWRAAISGAASQGWFEFPIVSDAHITSEIVGSFGPYSFLNPIADLSAKGFADAVIVRVEDHLPEEDYRRAMEQTDEAWFHGGWLQEELAALVSLGLGIRARRGGTSRESRFRTDPRGHPVGWERSRDPIPLRGQRARLSRPAGSHSLDDVQQLALYPHAAPELAIALIRSARLYQDALWIADVEPNLAWVLLTSAVETAAGFWRSTEDDPIERLRTSRPELERLLLERGGPEHLQEVAHQIAPYMGATRRFVDFLMQFLPDPPTRRAPDFARLPWDDAKNMRKVFTIIYKYRSRALHAGTPFPEPMSEPPMRFDGPAVAEVPTGLAIRMLGATWLQRDVPMLLDAFEYITRGALLKWWHSSVQRHQLSVDADDPD